MDFIRVAYKETQNKVTGETNRQYYPALLAIESQDLVVRGGQYAAIWDDTTSLYNRRISQAPVIIDRWFAKQVELRPGDSIKKVREFDNQIFSRFMGLIRNIGDMGPELDQKLVFANETPTKEIAATFKLAYSLSDASCPAWDEICTKLYGPEERLKFEYAIGSIISGDSLYLQKAYVFFGDPGTGKSTIMDIIHKLFEGHTGSFKSAELANASSQFSLEPFKLNPLVAIDQDADLSKIEINNILNQIISHDTIHVNAKGKSLFEILPRACCFIGTNKPVKITDSKSGLYRRIVDIHPTGDVFDETEYKRLTAAARFELGAIAQHCLNIFNELGPTYLGAYRPVDMMYRTNDIFNFVQEHRLVLQQGVTLKQAWKMYTEWCTESEIRQSYKQYQFRDLLKDYFMEWHDQVMVDGERHRSYYMGLRELDKFSWKGLVPHGSKSWLDMEVRDSVFEELMAEMPAQLSQENSQYPLAQKWKETETTLNDIDTSLEHFVKVPTKHIVIDFDEKDEHGNKSLEACLAKAALWPPTYAEPSRSGDGLHLHYDYEGDPETLAVLSDDGAEIKSLLGGASLRRRYTVSNGLPVAKISSGLPQRDTKPVISAKTMASEKGLRKQIIRGITKDVWPNTKSSMDFIKQVLDDAVAQQLQYDVSDMWDDILEFALGSTNQKSRCMEIALSLPLKSEEDIEAVPVESGLDKPLADFDCEVYPNLFTLGYLVEGTDEVVKMINPTAQQVQSVIENYRLVGFYNRLYDNHILWAASLGYSVEQLYLLSQSIIVENNRHKLFGAAYSMAYADLYDIFSEKKSLKKWMIELGLPHIEMDIPWDQPVPEDRVLDVVEYMANDILSTRAVRRARQGDWLAREMLAQLSGLEMCNTNNQHTTRLIFGDNRDPSSELQYTKLAEMFPGYTFDRFAPGKEKSTYKGIQVGEGGWVKSVPGQYTNVAVLDVASMHPSSIIAMNAFGKYTEKFKELMDKRLDAKARIKSATTDDERMEAKALSDALKIVINSVYGLTAASFPNAFKDERNIDNFVAKRGALFMVDVVEFVEKAGVKVVHVKTDSIKIPDATPELIAAVTEFGKKYGYDFEHETTYEKFCLVNDAVYVSKDEDGWSATGAQFKHPVVFKTLFSKEEILPQDYVEVKQVAKGAMYLVNTDETSKTFVGKFGAFIPVLDGRTLIKIDGEKQGAVSGTKGYLWENAEIALGLEKKVDMTYFQALVDDAMRNLEKYGEYHAFMAPF